MNKWQQLLKENGITPGKIEAKPMGQGFYTVLAFGCISEFDDEAESEKEYAWVAQVAANHRIQGRRRYEARQHWLGFFIAENGSGVSRDGDGCQLFSYEVLDAAKLVEEVEKRWPKQLAKCKSAYEDLRKTAKKNGVDLPDGRLLLVNDYD